MATSVMLLVWLLAGSTVAVAGPMRDTPEVSERVRYETASLALEEGQNRLGVQLLKELVATTSSDRARDLYLAQIASADGRLDRVDEILAELAGGSPDAAGGAYAWIEEPIVRLAAEQELARLLKERDERLEEVLEQHYEARGGLDRLRSMTDLVAIGRLVLGGQEFPIQLARKRPRLYRFDLQMPGGLRVEAFDGDVAWGFDGPRGDTQAAYLPDARQAELRRLAYFDDVLVRYRQTGEELYLRATETIDGRAYHPIDVSVDGKLVETVYLDAETLLEARRVVRAPDGTELAVREFEYTDVDGVMLPASQTIFVEVGSHTYHYDTYALDVDIPTEKFVLSEFNEVLAAGAPVDP